jgi:hypothetical protein
MEEAIAWMRKLLPPFGILTRVNSVAIETRRPVATVAARRRPRNKRGRISPASLTQNRSQTLQTAPGGQQCSGEMGIPIVEQATNGRCDVAQKIL